MTKTSRLDFTDLHKKIDSKVFFIPLIYIIFRDEPEEMLLYAHRETGTLLDNVWAGRVLAGQTIQEGLAAELRETLKYDGKFLVSKSKYFDMQKDKQGRAIERYKVDIVLFEKPNIDQEVMNCRLVLGGNTNNWDALSRERIAKGFPIALSNWLADLANEGIVTTKIIFDIWNATVSECQAQPPLSELICTEIASFCSQAEVVHKHEELAAINDGLTSMAAIQSPDERAQKLKELAEQIRQTATTHFHPEETYGELIHQVIMLRRDNGINDDTSGEVVLLHDNQALEDWLSEDTGRGEDFMIRTSCPLFTHAAKPPTNDTDYELITIGACKYYVKVGKLQPVHHTDIGGKVAAAEKLGRTEFLIQSDGFIR